MIKVGRMGRGDMIPPRPFIRDLQLLDRNFSVIWEPEAQKYAIISPAPVSVFRKGFVYEYLVESENGGYAPLDARVIREIRYLLWEKSHMDRLENYPKLQKKAERDRIDRMNVQTTASFGDFVKKCNKFQTTKTFT